MTGPSTVSNQAAEVRRGARRRVELWQMFVVAVVVIAAVPVARTLERPKVVDRLDVANETTYSVRIEVTGAERDGWVAVGTAPRGTTSTFEGVLDQGDVWVFRFASQGERGGEFRLRRGELESRGWRFSVPRAVENELRARGAAESPCRGDC